MPGPRSVSATRATSSRAKRRSCQEGGYLKVCARGPTGLVALCGSRTSSPKGRPWHRSGRFAARTGWTTRRVVGFRPGREGETHLQTAASGAGSVDRARLQDPTPVDRLTDSRRPNPRTSPSGERRTGGREPGRLADRLRPGVEDSWSEFQYPRALGTRRPPSVRRGTTGGLRRGRGPRSSRSPRRDSLLATRAATHSCQCTCEECALARSRSFG